MMIDPQLIRRYDTSGPRYTSYPTAVQFDDSFDQRAFQQALTESNGAPIPSPLSIYIHIPFCRQLCFYCACNKLVTQDPGKAVEYLGLLDQEAALQSELLDPDREVKQLHLGGGSPTFLDDRQIESLVRMLSRRFNLDDTQGEWSIEVDPRTVTASRMKHLAALGFNRVSFGVQDVNESVQVAVNRVQSLQQIFDCVAAARQAGMQSVSIDLIYGLPFQTVATFEETLKVVQQLKPDRIAIYNYAHLPGRFKSQRLIRERYLPSAETKLALQSAIRERLDQAGYVHIGMDHYARPEDELVQALYNGSLQRNFQGYSTHAECELIGLGVSSISAIGGCFAQNEHRLPEYRRRVMADEIPICRGLSMSDDDQIRARVIGQIMCTMRIDPVELKRLYGVDFEPYFDAERSQIRQLIDDGLLLAEETGYRVSEVGRYFLRNIAMCFDRYLTSNGQFSKVL